MRFLKTNTAVRITVGPFLDYSDGVTPETSLTVTNTTCELYVDADDGSGVTRTAITLSASGGNNDMVHVTDDVAGMYDVELTASQLNVLGRAKLVFTDVDVHLPVFEDFMILPAVVYNSIVAGSDYLQVDTVQVSGSGPAADNLETAALAYSATRGLAGTALPAAAADAAGGLPISDAGGLDLDAQISTKITAIYGKLPSKSYLTGTANSDGDIQADEATGNFPGSVASVAGAVGSVTGAVGSVTAGVNVTQIEGVDATNQIRDAVVDDATRIDASALNTLSSHDPGATLSSLTAAQANAECDTALADAGVTSTRMGYLTGAVALEATLTAIKGAGWTTETLKAIKDYVDDLESRLTSARAGYLDELGAANIPADIDTLLGRITALRAGYLDNLSGGAAALQASVDDLETRLTAARAGYLDNLSAGAVALEANVAGHVTTALGTYDPPTRAELTSDKAEILAGISGLNDISVADILAGVVTGTLTLQNAVKILVGMAAGKTSGGGTANLVFRNYLDTQNLLTITADENNNRVTVTVNLAD